MIVRSVSVLLYASVCYVMLLPCIRCEVKGEAVVVGVLYCACNLEQTRHAADIPTPVKTLSEGNHNYSPSWKDGLKIKMCYTQASEDWSQNIAAGSGAPLFRPS